MPRPPINRPTPSEAARESDPALPKYDLTARKAHQWTMVALIAVGFLLGSPEGAIPVALAGAIMLLGRFWWPADVVRQLVWRVMEPWGLLRRREAHEDRQTRRVARTIGGIVWLGSALLLVSGADVPGWILAAAVSVMVVLDATVDFCALCFVVSLLERRSLLVSDSRHAMVQPGPGE